MNKKCPKCNTENPLHAKYCRTCGNKFDEEPEITDFHMNSLCRIGDEVEFSWGVSNAGKVTLNGRNVTGQARVRVTVKGDEDYILVATKGKSIVSKTIQVRTLKENSKSTPQNKSSLVDLLRRNKFSFFIIWLAIVILISLRFFDTAFQYYLNISYSKWLNITTIAYIAGYGLLLIGVSIIIFSIIKLKK